MRLASTFLPLALAFAALPTAAQTVRIGVLGIFHTTQLTLSPSEQASLEVTSAGRSFRLPAGSAAQLELTSFGNQIIVKYAGQELVAESLHAAGRNQEETTFALSVPHKITQRYRGTLEIKERNGELVPVVTMDLETAVAAIVQAESLSGSPLEALKAQAVVTRSYLTAGKGRHQGFDFCDLTHCQVLRDVPPPGSRVATAVQATRGLIISFQEKVVAAMFTRSCGGHTLSLRDVGIPAREYPYFAVFCKMCHQHPARWSETVSQQDAALLAGHHEAARLAVARRLGWNTVRSNNFSEQPHEAAVTLVGIGQGHGVGLCQRGASDMAELGATFRAILKHYFPNTVVAHAPTG